MNPQTLLYCLVFTSMSTHGLTPIGLVLITITWLDVCLTYGRKDPEVRKERVEDALKKDPSALTERWYRNWDVVCSLVKCILLASAVYVFLCSPQLGYYENKMEELWDIALPHCEEDFASVLFAIHFVTFWLLSFFFTFLDSVVKESPYKIQRGKRQSFGKLCKCVAVALFNQFLSLSLLTLLPIQSVVVFSPDLPTISLVVSSFGTYIVVAELWFYSWHRLMHKYDFLYNNFHKMHHTITAPTAVTAIYAHPVEHVILNFPTLSLGPFLCQSHYSLWCLWSLSSTIATCHAHSGWHLPFWGSPEVHDFHHSYGTENFGIATGILDELFHTQKIWDTSPNKKVDLSYTTPDYPVDKVLVTEEKEYKDELFM